MSEGKERTDIVIETRTSLGIDYDATLVQWMIKMHYYRWKKHYAGR